MEIEQSASINEKSDEETVKENEETKEKKRKRNREYQRAWRQRKKDLKKKVSKEEKEEKKRKRHRKNQKAYYYRLKGLKENDKNVEELSQKKLDDMQIKRKKLNSNEDQENVVQCKDSQNLENVQLKQNQFLTQQLRIYEESHECITPKVILYRNTDIPGDGNCLFHSLIRVLRLQILTCDLRRQLRDSPYLNSCHNPQEAYNILSSNNEYGDLDCLYLFAKIYNQNICVHYHYFNVISNNEDTRFCHFKANDTHNWIHLDLREQHFTPYFSDDEKKKEDERKQKQMFPERNTEWNNDWCKIIRNCRSQDDWVPSKTSVICSAHFDTNDLYTTKNGIRRVTTYAVPQKLLFESPKTQEVREKPQHVQRNIPIAPHPGLPAQQMPPIITGGWATLSEQLSSFEPVDSKSESVAHPQTTLIVQLKAEPEEPTLYHPLHSNTSTYLPQTSQNIEVKCEPEEPTPYEPSDSISTSTYLPQTTPMIEVKTEEPTSFEPSDSISTFAYLPQLPVKIEEEANTSEPCDSTKERTSENSFFVMIPPNVGRDWAN